MKRLIAFVMILSTFMIAADLDMDGVSDKHDQCKHTPFWAVVNSRGCAVKHIRYRKK